MRAIYEETALIASVRGDQLTRVDNAKIRWDASTSTFEFLDAQEQDIDDITIEAALEVGEHQPEQMSDKPGDIDAEAGNDPYHQPGLVVDLSSLRRSTRIRKTSAKYRN